GSQKLSRARRVRNRITRTGTVPAPPKSGGRMKIKRAVLAPMVIASIALATGGWFLQRGVSREGNVYTQARLFEEVLHRISDDYVDPKDPASLYKMAIDGLLHELGVPYTAFMTPDDYNNLKITTQGEYGGIGSEITKRDGWITIMAP